MNSEQEICGFFFEKKNVYRENFNTHTHREREKGQKKRKKNGGGNSSLKNEKFARGKKKNSKRKCG